MDEILKVLQEFARLFRKGPPLPTGLVFMPLVVAVVWPLAHIASGDPRAAFMLTFVITMALRFALGADKIILGLARYVSPRTSAIVVLMAGPGLIAALIWSGNPIWCQRLLSIYFGSLAVAYAVDTLLDATNVLAFQFTRKWHQAPASLLARMMVIYNMAMLLLNETLIVTAGYGAWLVFFALLPQFSQRMALALARTAHPTAAI